MIVAPGVVIGGYEVVALLGAGGMGEVYRARDRRLGRDIAIKILPEALAVDAHRRARLEREARALASLNHPNVATLYGIEDTSAGQVLVMELVEGDTLADRLALAGRDLAGLPVREAVAIAQQVAAALEAAHEHGIVHRDLKPANIAVRPDGTVKVLDFGLAQTLEGELSDAEGAAAAVTLTNIAAGMGPGTPAYMSPEQARGVRTDKRTDIWAFGCVLYELLTGQRPFGGERTSDVVARILEREPDFDALPSDTPAAIRRLLRRCLEKDPQDRLRDIGDARLELRDALGAQAETVSIPRGRLFIVAPLVIGSVVALAGWLWGRPNAPTPAPFVRMDVRLTPGVTVARGPQFASSVALSPDGRTLVIAGKTADGQRLYQRPLNQLEPTPLAGTQGGSSPFFSRDGAWIGFFVGGRMMRVPAGGGAAVDIAVALAPQFPKGATWGPDNRIVFSTGANTALQVVDASGGNAEPLTTLAPGETSHGQPEILPDGGTLLFTVIQKGASWIHALDLKSGRRTPVVQGAAPRYTSSGHLLLSRGTTLLVAAFDPLRLEITGAVAPFVEDVANETNGSRHYAISPDGAVAYVPGARTHALVIAQKDGTEQTLGGKEVSFENPQFSPDGERLVVAATRRAGEAPDLWIHDRRFGTASRLTFGGGRAPVWTRDGTAVAYSHSGAGPGIYVKAADGRGEARQLVALDTFHWLVGWTPDGTLVYGLMEGVGADGTSSSSIMAFAQGKSQRVVGPGSTWGGRLSPDGQLLAYYSLESGGFEVYVTPFPQGGTRWLISEGTDPKWGPDGREIYYRSGNRLEAARIDTAAGLRVLSRRLVIEPFSPPLYDDYDIHPDGRTLVTVRPVGDAVGRTVTMFLNSFTELRATVRIGTPATR